eukprot:PhM_4_TR17558/c0_g1_i1/m.42680
MKPADKRSTTAEDDAADGSSSSLTKTTDDACVDKVVVSTDSAVAPHLQLPDFLHTWIGLCRAYFTPTQHGEDRDNVEAGTNLMYVLFLLINIGFTACTILLTAVVSATGKLRYFVVTSLYIFVLATTLAVWVWRRRDVAVLKMLLAQRVWILGLGAAVFALLAWFVNPRNTMSFAIVHVVPVAVAIGTRGREFRVLLVFVCLLALFIMTIRAIELSYNSDEDTAVSGALFLSLASLSKAHAYFSFFTAVYSFLAIVTFVWFTNRVLRIERVWMLSVLSPVSEAAVAMEDFQLAEAKKLLDAAVVRAPGIAAGGESTDDGQSIWSNMSTLLSVLMQLQPFLPDNVLTAPRQVPRRISLSMPYSMPMRLASLPPRQISVDDFLDESSTSFDLSQAAHKRSSHTASASMDTKVEDLTLSRRLSDSSISDTATRSSVELVSAQRARSTTSRATPSSPRDRVLSRQLSFSVVGPATKSTDKSRNTSPLTIVVPHFSASNSDSLDSTHSGSNKGLSPTTARSLAQQPLNRPNCVTTTVMVVRLAGELPVWTPKPFTSKVRPPSSQHPMSLPPTPISTERASECHVSRFLTVALPIIKNCGGTVHSYRNGEVIVYFTAQRCLGTRPASAGLVCTEELLRVATPSLHIGLDESECWVGSIGSPALRLFQELRGDAVDAALRLSMLAEEIGSRVLMSEQIRGEHEHFYVPRRLDVDDLTDAPRARRILETRCVGYVACLHPRTASLSDPARRSIDDSYLRLVGTGLATPVYEGFIRCDDDDDDDTHDIETFSRALELVCRGDVDEAVDLFREVMFRVRRHVPDQPHCHSASLHIVQPADSVAAWYVAHARNLR